jgi:hypothetical protein
MVSTSSDVDEPAPSVSSPSLTDSATAPLMATRSNDTLVKETPATVSDPPVTETPTEGVAPVVSMLSVAVPTEKFNPGIAIEIAGDPVTVNGDKTETPSGANRNVPVASLTTTSPFASRRSAFVNVTSTT